MTRLIFRKSYELVAVRNFRLDAATLLKPGDPLPEGVRLYHRMSLYRRGLVGSKDDPWTLARIPKPEVEDEDETELDETEVEDESDEEGETPDTDDESETEVA